MEVMAVICLLGSALVLLQPLNLDLKQLNFETPKTAELTRWFFENSGEGGPFTLADSPAVQQWANENHIRYEGMFTLIPAMPEQSRHLATWEKPCVDGLFKKDPQAAKFFEPFNKLVCGNISALKLSLFDERAPRRPRVERPNPAYLLDFTNGQDWTAILFPADDGQAAAIRAHFPSATSPRELISEFPKTFAGELSWMLPLSLLGALAFLLYHYRNLGLALLACVPFFTGVGGFALMALPLDLPITFVTLAGLLMVFGFSLDYGIFAVDYMLDPSRERVGVWSALTICAVSTTAGFTPMAMGQHPVLHSLGHALLWGSIGTFIGTFWGVPAGYRWLFAARKPVTV